MSSKDGQFKQYNGTNWDDLNPKTKWELITGKPTNYPPSAHTHSEYVKKQEDIYTYPYIGTTHIRSNTGGQAFKIVLPYNGATSSSNAWFMNTFEVVIGQSYEINSVCKLYFSYYALKGISNTWSVPNCQVFGVGSNLSNISNIYYVTNNPAIIYITFTHNNYITMSINNLTANDSANSYDFRNTTISLDDLPNTSTLTNIPLTYISANANTQEIDVNKKLTVKAPIVAYEYVNSNNAALIMDKPGSNYTGMGAHSIADTIWFGACNGNGNWVDTYKQIWQFNGSIKADSETIGSGGTGSGDSSTSPKLEIDGGTLRLKNYGITVDIGSQNGSYVHFANNSSVPFYFNNGVSVNGSIYENGTSLASKYLGISATAADSSKLNGQNPSYYLNYNNLNNKPTIGNATLNIKTEGTSKGTFGANATSNVEINITAADLGLSAALKFLGTTTTALSDGATTNPITVGGSSVTVTNGNVVIYGNKEFLWNGSSWEELGDESSYALKTVTITGTGALTGGGSLEQNRTISLNSGGADTVSIGLWAFGTDAYSRISSVRQVIASDIPDLSGIYLPLSGGTVGTGGTGSGNSSESPILKIQGGVLEIKNYETSLSIGSHNTSFVHFNNNQNKTYYFNNSIAVDGNLYPYSNNSVNLGQSSNYWANIYGTNIYENGTALSDKYLERLAWWQYEDTSKNVDDLISGTTFAYQAVHNCPTTGPIVAFASRTIQAYGLQLQGCYGESGNKLYFRTNNGDTQTWNDWKEIIHSGNYNNYVLPLTGGELYNGTNDTPLAIKSATGSAYIQFKNSGGTTIGYLGINSSKQPVFYDTSNHRLAYYSDLDYCVKYGGNQNVIGSNSPASGAETWATSSNLPNGNALIYNSAGAEYSLLYSFNPSNLNLGSILKWGYSDTYLRILRCINASWQSDDWEKISAGYADNAGSSSNTSYNYTNIISEADFNLAQKSGFYNVRKGDSSSIPNATSTNNAIHMCWDNGSNTGGFDLLINDNGDSPLYYRARVGGGGIGVWKQLATTSDLNSYLLLSGGTLGSGGTGTNDSTDSAKLEVDGGIIKIKNFSNTFSIGQRNTSFVHFENTNGATFYFGNQITVAGMVYPYTDDTYYLGGANNQWNRIYGKTIFEDGTRLVNKYVKRKETILESAIDLNSVVSTGFYMIGSTYKHGPDSSGDTYNSGTGSYAQLLVGQSGNDTLFQMLFRYNTTEVYFRTGYNIGVSGYTPVYSDWKKIANSSEIPDISGKLDKSAFSLSGTTLTLTL